MPDSSVAHFFDEEFYAEQKAKFDWFISRHIESIVISGEENARILENNKTIVYVSTHKSHADYMVIGLALYMKQLKAPRYAAGTNLLIWPLGNYLKKLGAISVDRKKKNDRQYIGGLRDYVQKSLETGEHLVVFIEGGRSYDGTLKQPQTTLIDSAIKAQKSPNRKRDIAIVPVAVSYDRIIEAGYFSEISAAKEMQNSKSRIKSFFGTIKYYLEDIAAFTFAKRIGNAYIDIGNPIDLAGFLRFYNNLDDSRLRKELANRSLDAAGKLYRVLPSALVANTIKEVDGFSDEGIPYMNIEQILDEKLKKLSDSNANIDSISKMTTEEIFEKGIEVLVEEGAIATNPIIGITSYGLLEYYSNTIKHLFRK